MSGAERAGELLQKNLSLLESLDKGLWERVKDIECSSEYQIFPSRVGAPTLRIGDTLIHSSYDPAGEGKRWAEHHLSRWDGFSTPLVFGFGLGYHILELNNLIDRPFLATVTLHQALYRLVERRIKLLERFRILVVGPIYGGSLPIAGYTSSALKELGYKVEYLDLSISGEAFHSIANFTGDEDHRVRLKGLFTLFCSEVVMARVVDFKPDLVFALAQAPLTGDLPSRLRGYKIPTALWFVEDFRTMDYWREIVPLYDYFFTIQDGEFHEILKGMGVRNLYYLPLAASLDVHRPVELTEEEIKGYGSDVSFVGAGYYNRRNLFLRLTDFHLKIWGNEWDGVTNLYPYIQKEGKRVSTEEGVKIFNASKVNINLHSSTHHEGVNPYGDFVNPRTFEIAACGGFQLVDYRSHLPRFFKIGKEIVTFTNINDLRDKIAYYLSRPEERREMGERARARVLKGHTYRHRMEEVMDFLIERGFDGTRGLPGRYLVKDLIKEAGRDTGLAQYLSRFMERRSVTLSEIIDAISRGHGDLSKSEAIFIMMNEFLNRKG